eukprot:Em0008g760a
MRLSSYRSRLSESSPATIATCTPNATDDAAVIVVGSVGGAAMVVCIPVLILVVALKLYKQLVYRLALYLVLSALMFSVVTVLHVAQIPFLKSGNHSFDDKLCQAAAFLSTYTLWVKVLLMLCVAIHLFAYSVCFKNLKKLEATYVVMSLTVPLAVSSVPLATGSYGPAGEWCWIVNWRDNCFAMKDPIGYAEQLALWFVPTSILLLVSNGLMIAMLVVLYRRVHRGESPLHREQYRKALRHILPTAVYPMSFLVLFLPTVARRISEENSQGARDTALVFADGFCTAAYGLVAALTLLWHILVVVWSRRQKALEALKKRQKLIKQGPVYGAVATLNSEFSDVPSVLGASINCSESTEDAHTVYVVPPESEVDRRIHGHN